jgi:hypothetical protein
MVQLTQQGLWPRQCGGHEDGSTAQHCRSGFCAHGQLAPTSTRHKLHNRLGYKVALLDADVGLRNLDLLLGLENRVLYTAIDILEGDCR